MNANRRWGMECIKLLSVLLVIIGAWLTLAYNVLGITVLLSALTIRMALALRLTLDRLERLEEYLNMTDD